MGIVLVFFDGMFGVYACMVVRQLQRDLCGLIHSLSTVINKGVVA